MASCSRGFTTLAACACLAAGLCGVDASSPVAQAKPRVAAPDLEQMFDAVNARRLERGLRALTVDSRLMRAAATQAAYLARTGRLEHRGPDGSDVGQRARRAGYQWSRVAENLASSKASSARAVVQMWMNSRAHRTHMLNRNYTERGGAHVGAVWVLVLARPRQ